VAKHHFVLSRGDYTGSTKLVVCGARGQGQHWQGDRTQTTIWEIVSNNPFGNRQREQSWGHGTRSRWMCMRRPIANTAGRAR